MSGALMDALRGLPLVEVTLLVLVLDILYAIVRWAMRHQHPGDPPLLSYLEGRVTIAFILGVAALLDTLVPDIPLLDAAAAFYLVVCGAAILDHASADGVPIPPQLAQILHSLSTIGQPGRPTLSGPAPSPTSTTTD